MRTPRLQFSIGGLMLVIALLAVLLGGWFPFVSPLVVVPAAWRARRRAVESGGGLLLRAARPRVRRAETVGFAILAALFMASLARLALDPARSDALPPPDVEIARFCVVLCLVTVPTCLCGRITHLEFCERGLVCGTEFRPWEGVRGWGWTRGGATLMVKAPHGISWYRLAAEDRARVQEILERCVGPESPPTAPAGTSSRARRTEGVPDPHRE